MPKFAKDTGCFLTRQQQFSLASDCKGKYCYRNPDLRISRGQMSLRDASGERDGPKHRTTVLVQPRASFHKFIPGLYLRAMFRRPLDEPLGV